MGSFRCVQCGRSTESEELDVSCSRCGSAVTLDALSSVSTTKGQLEDLPPGVWRYRSFLPEIPSEEIVTLGEGATPLLRAERLGQEFGLPRLLLKDESRNPTGSFLDRGSTVLLSLARGRGVRECACVTTGNLGASLSAYCAKANMKAHVRVNPSTDQGKLFQMLAYGAEIEASSSRSLSHSKDRHLLTVTAANPYLLEGEKTTGFELIQELGWKAPDVVVVPVGTGGHLSMIWRSMVQLRESGILRDTHSRLLGVRLEGSKAIMPFGKKASSVRGSPLAELEESEHFFLKEAEESIAQSRGTAIVTTARGTLAATSLLARTEGIFAEPSSASVIAALEEAVERREIDKSETVVCIITGAGLKDTRAVTRLARQTKRVALREGFAMRAPAIGVTKLAILHLLQRGPGYGYELWLALGSERRISTASVYQHLSELEGLSLVRRGTTVVEKGRERVVYELTRRGAELLKMIGKLGPAPGAPER